MEVKLEILGYNETRFELNKQTSFAMFKAMSRVMFNHMQNYFEVKSSLGKHYFFFLIFTSISNNDCTNEIRTRGRSRNARQGRKVSRMKEHAETLQIDALGTDL